MVDPKTTTAMKDSKPNTPVLKRPEASLSSRRTRSDEYESRQYAAVATLLMIIALGAFLMWCNYNYEQVHVMRIELDIAAEENADLVKKLAEVVGTSFAHPKLLAGIPKEVGISIPAVIQEEGQGSEKVQTDQPTVKSSTIVINAAIKSRWLTVARRGA